MADPDHQIRGRGAPGRPDPEIRGEARSPKKFFGPSGAASVWSKRAAPASQAPPLDPPLLYTKWAVDHSPTPVPKMSLA